MVAPIALAPLGFDDNGEEFDDPYSEYYDQERARRPSLMGTPDPNEETALKRNKCLLITAFLTFSLFAVAEMIGGIAGRSLSLIEDAATMLVDACTYGFNYYAEVKKKGAPRRTVLKYEIVPPAFSVVALILTTGFITYMATDELFPSDLCDRNAPGRGVCRSITATAALGPYPGYSGPFRSVRSVVSVTASSTSLSLTATLAGVPPSTTAGIHIHAGSSCGAAHSVAGHWYNNNNPGLADPWTAPAYTYTSNAAGNATVAFNIARDQIGFDPTLVVNHTVVVHGSTNESSGVRIACGVLVAVPDPANPYVYSNSSAGSHSADACEEACRSSDDAECRSWQYQASFNQCLLMRDCGDVTFADPTAESGTCAQPEEGTNVLVMWVFSGTNLVLDFVNLYTFFVAARKKRAEIAASGLPDPEANANMMSAFTHIVIDTMRSLAVMVAAAASSVFGVDPGKADAICALCVTGITLLSTFPLFKLLRKKLKELARVKTEHPQMPNNVFDSGDV